MIENYILIYLVILKGNMYLKNKLSIAEYFFDDTNKILKYVIPFT